MQTEKRKNYLQALELQDALLDIDDAFEIKVNINTTTQSGIDDHYFIEVLYNDSHARFMISNSDWLTNDGGRLIGIGFQLNAKINDPVKIKQECINRCLLVSALNKNKY